MINLPTGQNRKTGNHRVFIRTRVDSGLENRSDVSGETLEVRGQRSAAVNKQVVHTRRIDFIFI